MHGPFFGQLAQIWGKSREIRPFFCRKAGFQVVFPFRCHRRDIDGQFDPPSWVT
jgi:hypothetical protein